MTPRPAICVTKRDRKLGPQQDCRRWNPPAGCCCMIAWSSPTGCRTSSLTRGRAGLPLIRRGPPHPALPPAPHPSFGAHPAGLHAGAAAGGAGPPLAAPQCRHTGHTDSAHRARTGHSRLGTPGTRDTTRASPRPGLVVGNRLRLLRRPEPATRPSHHRRTPPRPQRPRRHIAGHPRHRAIRRTPPRCYRLPRHRSRRHLPA